ncbi:MAG: hypothetical protein DKM50_05055 [Candidatus Margulisiibacteriota bacterium]|nr:MAG: hypothetical protein A2X43_10725 [Candidatus Margulisbacteria bacterium GWD2_39_127]OGI03393.1 MAG: hypothetical protein A2X42_03370 [Candidatus Margulisbacteria bacterium GWF2_38_17]OGI06573.1 MAG: hypothetical protein A2X41_00510 [Candidatus Margulisbacteria bacterium GWE2_39_32]PZM81904.1 MAG: hypothetical protein DKM50_05055 [Candidatus Margulisiibacteriota bacterium]HAR64077.1 hypothetical protein [Candidatus Margulisiibacteriota bacterium]
MNKKLMALPKNVIRDNINPVPVLPPWNKVPFTKEKARAKNQIAPPGLLERSLQNMQIQKLGKILISTLNRTQYKLPSNNIEGLLQYRNQIKYNFTVHSVTWIAPSLLLASTFFTVGPNVKNVGLIALGSMINVPLLLLQTYNWLRVNRILDYYDKRNE